MISTPWPSVSHWFEGLGPWWHAAKTVAEHALGFSNDALHVLVGVILQLVLARLMTVSIGHVAPWLGVLTLELLNEWSDLSFEIWPDSAMQWGESVKDVLLTMALPSILLIVSRRWPDLLNLPAIPPTDPIETTKTGELEHRDP
jgi:hypothetical protein